MAVPYWDALPTLEFQTMPVLYQAVTVPGLVAGTTGVDIVLATYTLPANQLGPGSNGIAIVGWLTTPLVGGASEVKLVYNPFMATVGGTMNIGAGIVLADITIPRASGHPNGFRVDVLRVGSGVQVAYQWIGSNMQPMQLLFTDETQPILLAITSNCVVNASDVQLNLFEVAAR